MTVSVIVFTGCGHPTLLSSIVSNTLIKRLGLVVCSAYLKLSEYYSEIKSVFSYEPESLRPSALLQGL